MMTDTSSPNWFTSCQSSLPVRWIGIITAALLVFSAVPEVAWAQATCGVTGETFNSSWRGVEWVVDSDGDGSFESSDDNCPISENGVANYPDQGDTAIIPADERIQLDIDLTSSGQGPLQSLELKSGSSNDASGTLLELNSNDLATSGDVTNNSEGSNNGLVLTSTGGTGSLTVGGRLVNSGNIRADNTPVQILISGQFDNNSGANVNLATADTLFVGSGIENDASGTGEGITASGMQGIEVRGSTIRNRGDLDISNSRMTIGANSSLAENGTTFNSGGSKVIFNGDDQSISGSGSAGDGTVDIVFEEIKLKNSTTVDPSIDVRINTDLTVKLGSTWGASGEDSQVTFEGDNFAILQATTASETDATFRSSLIRFIGPSTTSVKGEVFSDVRVESDLSLAEDFEIDGFYEHLTSTVTVGTSNSLDLEQDAEINGDLTVNGTLQFSGLGGTSTGISTGDGGDDAVQDVVGTGSFSFNGLEILGSGTDVDVRRTEGQSLDVGSLFIEGFANNPDAALDVTSDVFVSGGLTADGNFTLEGKLTMDGSGAQTISAADPFEVNVLESANGSSQDLALASGTEIRITDILELAAGTFDVSQGNLTLESSQTSHAVITYNGGDIAGNITIQRELSTGPDWYFLANPEGTTYDTMLRQGNENNFWIQGHSGADVSESGASFSNTNLFEYNEQEADSSRDNSWSRSLISSMSDPAERGRGFILYPFTDDNNDGTNDSFPKQLNIQVNPTTTNSFSFSVTGTDRNNSTTSDGDDVIDAQEGWNLLGNPYLTNIIWKELSRTNVDNAVYVYEPLGGYRTFNGSTTDDGDSTFVSDGLIGPFQAFFVKAKDGTDPSTASYELSVPNIQEVQRDSLSSDLSSDPFLKSAGSPDDRVLALRVDAAGIKEETKFTFRRDGERTKDVSDAYQLEAPGEIQSGDFLSFYSVLDNGNALSINNLPYTLDEAVRVPVQPELRGCDGSTPYQAQATIALGNLRDIPSDWGLVLKDIENGEKVNLRDSDYTFTLESSTASSVCSQKRTSTSSDGKRITALPSPTVKTRPVAAKKSTPSTRFELIIQKAGTLPVEISNFGAKTTGKTAVLNWTTASEQNNAGFYVQRKTDEGSFTTLDGSFVEGAGTASSTNEYSYRVGDLDAGTHTFRLKQVDTDGSTSFSDPVDVKVGLSTQYKLKTYPNPVRTQATVEFAIKEQADVTIALYNTLGQKVRTVYQGTPPAEETKRAQVDTQNLSSGVYFLRLQGEGVTGTQRMTVVK